MPGLLSVVLIGVWIFAFIDVLVTDRAHMRTLPKWAWVALVLLLGPIGALGWFLFGRPARTAPTPSSSAPAPPRPAPLRRPRPPTRAQRAEEEAQLREAIAERDRLIAQWAEEDRRRASQTDE